MRALLLLICIFISWGRDDTEIVSNGSTQGFFDPSLSPVDYGMHRACGDNFLTTHGRLGEWGLELIQAIETENLEDCFYEKIDFSAVCPNYKTMRSPSQSDPNLRKKQFLAFLFAAMGDDESDCELNGRVGRGTNGKAYGLYQLEDASLRRKSGRSRKWCPNTGIDGTKAVQYQFQCSVSIFADGFCNRRHPLRAPAQKFWYWQELNPGPKRNGVTTDKKITKAAKKFPYCQ